MKAIQSSSTNVTLIATVYNADGSVKTDLAFDTTGISIFVQRIGQADGSPLFLSDKTAPENSHVDGAFLNLGGGDISVDIPDAPLTDFLGLIRIYGTFTAGDGGTIVGAWYPVVGYNPDVPAVGAPTVAQLNDRTLPAASYFDPTTDAVIVGTNNDKTGYSLALAPPSAASIADEVRIELTTELARIDMPISGLLGAFSTVTDWTANERTALRAILGIPNSGTTPEVPTSGILHTIASSIDALPTATETYDYFTESTRADAFKADVSGLATTTQLNDRTLPAADYFNPTTDAVTVGTNNDKIGYELAADQAVNVTKVGGTSVSGPNDLKADVSSLATTAQLNDRTLLAADYFNPATDTVTVGTNNDKSGYGLATSDPMYRGSILATGVIAGASSDSLQITTAVLPDVPRDHAIIVGTGENAQVRYLRSSLAIMGTHTIKIDQTWVTTPTAGTPFIILALRDPLASRHIFYPAGSAGHALSIIYSNTNSISERLPVALVDGKMSSYVATADISQALTSYGAAKTADVTAVPAGVWSHATRTLSAFGFSVTVGTNNDKTGYSLTQVFPGNFASLGINPSGHISRVTLVDATTSDSNIAAIKAKTDNLPADPAATSDVSPTINFSPTIEPTTLDSAERGAIATAVRSELNTELGRIDVAISSRSTFAGGAVASVTSPVTVGTNNDKTGYSLTQVFPGNFASLGINSSGHISRVTLVDATAADSNIAAIKAKTDNLPADPAAASDVSPTINFSPTIEPTTLDVAEREAIADEVRAELAVELARIDVAVSSIQAAAGGTDWTANERAAIKAVLGIPAVGTTPVQPDAGALHTLATTVAGVPQDVWTYVDRSLTTGAVEVEIDSAALATAVATEVVERVVSDQQPDGSVGHTLHALRTMLEFVGGLWRLRGSSVKTVRDADLILSLPVKAGNTGWLTVNGTPGETATAEMLRDCLMVVTRLTNGQQQSRWIASHFLSSGDAGFNPDEAFSFAPAAGDTLDIYRTARWSTSVGHWKRTVPGNLDSNGYVPSNTASINGNTTAVSTFRTWLDNNRLDFSTGLLRRLISVLAGKSSDPAALAEMQATTAGATFDNATDSLEASSERAVASLLDINTQADARQVQVLEAITASGVTIDVIAAEVNKIPRAASPLTAGNFQFTIVGGQSLTFSYGDPV